MSYRADALWCIGIIGGVGVLGILGLLATVKYDSPRHALAAFMRLAGRPFLRLYRRLDRGRD
ncbi:hypothetical protein [Kutzneria sp. NPDC051319]|uniref:hypothetical protein n=1 Tax=Kutzneria sp. NPDC051319 TaxID=3155047 RepID=UPI003415A222